MEFPPSETVAIPPRESGVGNYIVGDKMLCAQQSIPTKYFTLAVISPFSSNVSVLRERIIVRNADKICKRTREKCANLRASSPFGNIVKSCAHTEARAAHERGSPSRLRHSFASSRGSPRMAKWNRDLLAG